MKLLLTSFLVLFLSFSQAEELPAPTYTYHGVITDIYDGDTMTALIDLGFDVSYTGRLRILGIDTPELRGDEREEGLKVRDYVRELLKDKEVIIISHKKGKYGRWLASIRFIQDGKLMDLATILLEQNLAVPYE